MFRKRVILSLMLLSFLWVLNPGTLIQSFPPNIIANPSFRPTSPERDYEKGIVEASGMPLRSGSSSAPFGSSIDPGEMEKFFDQVISEKLTKYQIPGATVSVVKDGQLFFAKGYGWANFAENIPVRADQTLFRIGSTSKLFTWTAILQLVEQGKLDLDADVNTDLKMF